jgi:agmatine deiminase
MEYSMTAEFAPQRAAWMLWPLGNNVLCVNEIPLQKIFARVAMAISMATPTFVVVPKNQVDRASFIIPKHINLVTVDEYNYGLMNNFPFILKNAQKGGVKALCGKNTDAFSYEIVEHHKILKENIGINLDPLAFTVDGKGTCIVTEEYFKSQNLELSRDDISLFICKNLGVTKIIWLKQGMYGDRFKGYIDNLCVFIREREVILHWCEDENDPQYKISNDALIVLQNTTDALGRKLIVHKLLTPKIFNINNGESINHNINLNLYASYVGFIISNERVVMPLLDPNKDNMTISFMQRLFPDKDVIGVDAKEFIEIGLNLRRLAVQIPK